MTTPEEQPTSMDSFITKAFAMARSSEHTTAPLFDMKTPLHKELEEILEEDYEQQ